MQRWQILLTLWVCGLIEVYFADETGLTMQPYVPYGWQMKGHRLGLPARIAPKRLNLLGLLRLDNQLTVYHSEKALTGQFVVNCFADFVAKAHLKPVVIVLDNGPNHYQTTDQLNQHLQTFLLAYNHAKRLKTLKGLTPHEFVYIQWQTKPTIFTRDPTQLTLGLYT